MQLFSLETRSSLTREDDADAGEDHPIDERPQPVHEEHARSDHERDQRSQNPCLQFERGCVKSPEGGITQPLLKVTSDVGFGALGNVDVGHDGVGSAGKPDHDSEVMGKS